MATQEEFNAKVQELTQLVTVQGAQVLQEFQLLKDQVAAGQNIDLSVLGPLEAAIQPIADAVADPPVIPPVDVPPSDTPPVDVPPDQPPSDTPPVDTPPDANPPVTPDSVPPGTGV